MGLLDRLWRDKNAGSEEQRAAETGVPTEAQKEFAQKLKKEIAFKEQNLEGQSSEQKG